MASSDDRSDGTGDSDDSDSSDGINSLRLAAMGAGRLCLITPTRLLGLLAPFGLIDLISSDHVPRLHIFVLHPQLSLSAIVMTACSSGRVASTTPSSVVLMITGRRVLRRS